MIDQQLTIPQLKGQLAHTRISVGALGECLVARALEARGYAVAMSHYNGDLTVWDSNGVMHYVEVKTARKNTQGCYSFTLWKHWQGRQCADHKRADVVVLLCILKTGDAIPFVVPVDDLKDRHAVAITSYPTKYEGWLAPYRQTIKKLTL